MKTVKKINLDLANHGIIPAVDAVQGDEMTRQIQMLLHSDGKAFNLTGNEMISVAFEKPDGKRGWYDTLPNGEPAVERDPHKDNVILVSLAPAMLEIPGVVKTALIFKNRDNHQIASFPFVVNVEKNLIEHSEISNEYYKLRNFDEFYEKLLSSFVFTTVAQELTSEQKEQARKNIDAMQNGEADRYLSMNNYPIAKIRSLGFHPHNDGDDEVSIEQLNSITDENNNTQGVLSFSYPDGDGNVILRGVADGRESNDAATVGQVKAVDLTTEKTLTHDQKSQARSNIGAMEDTAELIIRESSSDEGKELATVSVSATGVRNEDGTDVLSGIVWFHEHHYDGSCILRNISDGKMDFDAATVGQLNAAVGDIETALDSIIAIQDSLIGGDAV